MCTLPPKLDCGSLITLVLLRTDPDNGCFKIRANFELSYFFSVKREVFNIIVTEGLFYSVQ